MKCPSVCFHLVLIGSALTRWSYSSRCCCLFFLFVVHHSATAADHPAVTDSTSGSRKNDDNDGDEDGAQVITRFLQACAEGNVELVEIMLEEHRDSTIISNERGIVNAQSEEGESCLHVAAIRGHTKVTELVLGQGNVKVDIRSTYSAGLRMTPLSWNVYGGHVDTVRVLLQQGRANPNLDMDSMFHHPSNGNDDDDDDKKKITVLDIVDWHLDGQDEDGPSSGGDGKEEDDDAASHRRVWREMRALLLEYGAKRYTDLRREEEEDQMVAEL
jgi:Ankyrin repeats (3 copies)